MANGCTQNRSPSLVRIAPLSHLALICFLLAGIAATPGVARPEARVFSSEAEKLFDQGLEAYKKGQYPKSRIHLQQLLELPRNQRSSAALLVLGKTLFRLNEYESA